MYYEGPMFYKIVHSSLMTTQHLQIPPDFVKHIFEPENSNAVLEGPSGKHWLVKFRKTEDGAFLQEGWKDFVRDHSLGSYEVLVFRYDGDLHFHIQIFDKTATQKEDAFTAQPRQDPKKHDELVQELVEPSSRRRGRPSGRRGRPPHHSSQSNEVENANIMNAALSFVFNLNHPYFAKCFSKSSSYYSSCVLKVPRDFARDHLPSYRSQVTLQNQSGLAWIVNYNIPDTICGGWGDFVRCNQLEEGDICVFELIAENTLSVHIIRVPTC